MKMFKGSGARNYKTACPAPPRLPGWPPERLPVGRAARAPARLAQGCWGPMAVRSPAPVPDTSVHCRPPFSTWLPETRPPPAPRCCPRTDGAMPVWRPPPRVCRWCCRPRRCSRSSRLPQCSPRRPAGWPSRLSPEPHDDRAGPCWAGPPHVPRPPCPHCLLHWQGPFRPWPSRLAPHVPGARPLLLTARPMLSARLAALGPHCAHPPARSGGPSGHVTAAQGSLQLYTSSVAHGVGGCIAPP